MMSINRTTININITASIIFITYIILNSIHSIDEKKVEIEKKNKVLPNVEMVNLKNDLIIKDITLPELEKRNLNLEKKKNLKLSPLKNNNPKNQVPQSVEINLIDYNNLRAQNLNEKQNNLSILQPVALEKKIKSISIKPIKKTSLKLMNISLKQNVNNKELIKFDKSKLIDDGKNILENIKDDFIIEFRWPLETKTHDKIYKILNECLFSQTVLLNKKNQIFGINGLIKRNEFTEKYSSIVRMPNNVYSNKENTIIKQISTKYLNNEEGRHLRILIKVLMLILLGIYQKYLKVII